MKFCPAGTQVGTPAWVPDEVEEDDGMTEESGVAKHWFVHLRRVGGRPSERNYVKIDTAGTNTALNSRAGSGIGANWPSGSSLVSIGQDGNPSCAWCLEHLPTCCLLLICLSACLSVWIVGLPTCLCFLFVGVLILPVCLSYLSSQHVFKPSVCVFC